MAAFKNIIRQRNGDYMVSSINSSGYGSFFICNDSAHSRPPALASVSGQICPQTGLWKNESYKVVTSVDKGEVMPQYQGRDVEWTYQPPESDEHSR